jgi:hypothetical protein
MQGVIHRLADPFQAVDRADSGDHMRRIGPLFSTCPEYVVLLTQRQHPSRTWSMASAAIIRVRNSLNTE